MKKFIHDDPDFSDLLYQVSRHYEARISPSLIEKDYWVTATLDTLHNTGLDIWFKGGTSLAKGFQIIERFSEDLDLQILAGRLSLPGVSNWKSDGKHAIAERREYFEALLEMLQRIGLKAQFAREQDKTMRSANIECHYEGVLTHELAPMIKRYILLEIGSARVEPYEKRTISSFVHDYLSEQKLLTDYIDNRPADVRCVHPLVTLIEKVDAICRHYKKTGSAFAPETFIRHYEDAVRVIRFLRKQDTPAPAIVGNLLQEMLANNQIRGLPNADDNAFQLRDEEKRQQLLEAYRAIENIFWGERISLENATREIIDWIAANQVATNLES